MFECFYSNEVKNITYDHHPPFISIFLIIVLLSVKFIVHHSVSQENSPEKIDCRQCRKSCINTQPSSRR